VILFHIHSQVRIVGTHVHKFSAVTSKHKYDQNIILFCVLWAWDFGILCDEAAVFGAAITKRGGGVLEILYKSHLSSSSEKCLFCRLIYITIYLTEEC
jgi:hypothetical protein